MNWADALPNLLIGLREGLEAGLVVSILLAAVRKAEASATAVWLGVAGALSVAASFAAVLVFTTAQLSSAAQQAVGGTLSVLAVGLVTTMIFWMRRNAATLTAHLHSEVDQALHIGVGALALTAFLAVGREGLETTLFLWAAVKASGSTVAPLFGAGIGVALAVTLCILLYRRAVRLNLSIFFNRTAVLLIVIAAGVLAYGLGDLQEAGLLPGQHWVAFDLTSHINSGTWWVALLAGVTDLQPTMTVLQVVAWVGYLGTVLTMFVRAGAVEPSLPTVSASPRRPSWFEQTAGGHRWSVGAGLVVAPAAVAGLVIALLPSASSASEPAVTVTDTACAPQWTSAKPGTVTFAVDNRTSRAGEINLDNAAGAVVAEIETIGPATTSELTARLGSGSYQFRCLMGTHTTVGQQVTVTGGGSTNAAVLPITVKDLTPANDAYQRYAAGQLTDLSAQVAQLRPALTSVSRATAEKDWLAAQLDWERVGASYDSFGDLGLAVDGLPDGLERGVHDPAFTGLHRIEYGLFHGQPTASLLPAAQQLAAAVQKVRSGLGGDDLAGDPTNLPIRAHEIMEDALRDHLSGIDDEGSHAAFALTYADTQVTRQVLAELEPLIQARRPGLIATLNRQLTTVQTALTAARSHGTWPADPSAPLADRQRVDAAVGALLQNLDRVPDLLEVPPTH